MRMNYLLKLFRMMMFHIYVLVCPRVSARGGRASEGPLQPVPRPWILTGVEPKIDK